MGIIKSIIGFFSTNTNQVENENLDAQEAKTMQETVQVSDVNKEIGNKPDTTNGQENLSTMEVKENENKVEKKGCEDLNKVEKENKGNAKNKMKIHNLIIIDESGSMSHLTNSTISGVNEVINTIKSAQEEHSESQEHFLTIVTFDTPGRDNQSVRYIVDVQPIGKVKDFKDYCPNGCTPLYDAMGMSLTRIHSITKGDSHSVGSVTVVTDGLENDSCEWNAEKLRYLIEQLKEEGWAFSYMGSVHDVKDVTDLLSIENYLEFEHNNLGASSSWRRERSAKHAYFDKMASFLEVEGEIDEVQMSRNKKNLASRYYEDRVTPPYVNHLKDNQIFVFGSNSHGIHNGGAAYVALMKFGAEYGKGEGIQGSSYAIPSTGSIAEFTDAVRRFIDFASEHPELHFFVTRVGCGNAGWSVSDVAPLFSDCVRLENVSLPEDFWNCLGLNMHNKL